MNGVQILMMNQNVSKGYGYLYNGYAVIDSKFAPSGWHVPNQSDYNTLINFLGGSSSAGGKLKAGGFIHWESPNTGATNETSFYAYGGGHRGLFSGFVSIKQSGYFSTQTIESLTGGTIFLLLRHDYESALVVYSDIEQGNSVRLIKDSTTLSDGETSTMTDYDGNVYDTICIGTQEWTVQNWKCTKLNDGTSLTKVTSDATWASATTGDLYYCAYDNNENYV